MGANSVIVIYGVRYQVTEKDEIKQLQIGKHPLVRAARKVGLNHYWNNCSIDGGEYNLLYIGSIIGEFGPEGVEEKEVSDQRFGKIQRDTRKKLAEGGFTLLPALFMQFEPDY